MTSTGREDLPWLNVADEIQGRGLKDLIRLAGDLIALLRFGTDVEQCNPGLRDTQHEA